MSSYNQAVNLFLSSAGIFPKKSQMMAQTYLFNKNKIVILVEYWARLRKTESFGNKESCSQKYPNPRLYN